MERQQLVEAHHLLADGDYQAGFEAYEVRKRLGVVKRLPFPEWSGEPLDGRSLVIWPEQGFGDQIQCARFYRRLGGRVIVVVRPELLRLFEPLGVELVEQARGTPLPRVDYFTHPFSVLRILGVRPQSIPGEPYLAGRAAGLGGIGVVGRGSPTNINDAHRSLPADQAARLLALPGAISLCPEDTGASDFQDTADIIAGLDLVITVDTSVAHLAGAMGKPVWILLSGAATDWRWGRSGATTPWYPTARLYRQMGGWDETLGLVERDLRARGSDPPEDRENKPAAA